MFIPKYYKVTDFEKIKEFINANSFGTVVTTEKGKPIATHIPLQLNKNGEEYYITGHVSYGNRQWRTFETCEEVLVIYQGSHAYISSSWYGHENVPTWNYQAVHIYGKATILEEDELKDDLAQLLKKYEKHRKAPILWENLSSQLLEKEIKGIVGIKIKINEIQAADKLSQNRNEEDYLSIIKHLKKEGNPMSLQVADVMENRLLKDK